jgi:hypothetical protein
MCNHERRQYCRVQTPSGHLIFSIQCLDCLELIKTQKHHDKLFLKPSEIPLNETIHAFIQRDKGQL